MKINRVDVLFKPRWSIFHNQIWRGTVAIWLDDFIPRASGWVEQQGLLVTFEKYDDAVLWMMLHAGQKDV